MTKGLLLDCDELVAGWAFATYNRFPMHVDRALGVVDNDQLVGAVLFTSYNSVNAELSYYGKNTVTVGIIRAVAKVALYELRLARCTVIVPKRPSFLLKKLTKFGFRYEGVQRRHYGPTDSARHTGCRFVVFREDMEKLAAEPSYKMIA
jgi:hypothetical protein